MCNFTGNYYKKREVEFPTYSILSNVPKTLNPVKITFGSAKGIINDWVALDSINLYDVPEVKIGIGQINVAAKFNKEYKDFNQKSYFFVKQKAPAAMCPLTQGF